MNKTSENIEIESRKFVSWRELIKSGAFIIVSKKHNKIDAKASEMTRANIDYTGVISTGQYSKIFWWSPVIGWTVREYSILQEKNNKIRTGIDSISGMIVAPQLKRLKQARILFGQWPDVFKIFHNYSNINAVLYAKHFLVDQENATMLFDGKSFINLKRSEEMDRKKISPDGVVIYKNKIVFIETDNWTHTIDTVSEKNKKYSYLIQSGWLSKLWFDDIKILYSSYGKRLISMEKHWCFDLIKNNLVTLDFIWNPYNYIPENDTVQSGEREFISDEREIYNHLRKAKEYHEMIPWLKRKERIIIEKQIKEIFSLLMEGKTV